MAKPGFAAACLGHTNASGAHAAMSSGRHSARSQTLQFDKRIWQLKSVGSVIRCPSLLLSIGVLVSDESVNLTKFWHPVHSWMPC